jgi:hypothetical protein
LGIIGLFETNPSVSGTLDVAPPAVEPEAQIAPAVRPEHVMGVLWGHVQPVATQSLVLSSEVFEAVPYIHFYIITAVRLPFHHSV